MMNIWTIMTYELLRMIRMRTVLIIMLAVPLILIFILGLALSSEFSAEEGEPAQARLAIVNMDTGPMRASLEQFLNTPEMNRFIETAALDSISELETKLREDTADYGLVVPANFSENLMRGETSDLQLYPGRSSRKNESAEMVVHLFLEQTKQMIANHFVLGQEQAAMVVSGSADAGLSSFPDDRRVEVGKLQDKLQNASATEYYSSSMLIMFLLFSGMSAAISVLTEKEQKTLDRMFALPLAPWKVILGKLLGVGIFSVIQAIIIISFTSFVYGVDWSGNLPGVAAVCLLTIIASISLAVILASLAKTSKMVESIYSMLIIGMTFLSGGMMVFFDEGIEKIGQFTLNYWANGSMLRFMMGGEPAIAVHYMNVLAWIAAALLALALICFRKAGSTHE